MTTKQMVYIGAALALAAGGYFGYRAYQKRNTKREVSAGVKKLSPPGEKKASGGLSLADFDPTSKNSKYGGKVEQLGGMALDKLLGAGDEAEA